MAQYVTPELVIDKLSPVLCPKASELIVNYDEHVLVNSYKFGLVYQRRGQGRGSSFSGVVSFATVNSRHVTLWQPPNPIDSVLFSG